MLITLGMVRILEDWAIRSQVLKSFFEKKETMDAVQRLDVGGPFSFFFGKRLKV